MENSKISKLRGILRKEGLPGLIGRLRYRRTGVACAKAPVLPDHIALLDHGHPRLTAVIAHFLQDLGITTEPQRKAPAGMAMHVGWPDNQSSIHSADMLFDIGPMPDKLSVQGLSLILTADATRLADTDRNGQHRIAFPTPPSGTSIDEWSTYTRTSHFALQRFALFCGRIAPGHIDYTPQMAPLPAPPRICLSMPELPDRRAAFLERGLTGFTVLDGLKRQPPWQGAAFSYRALARAALDLGYENLTVIQDDAVPCHDFPERLRIAESYFRRSGADMFSGLITDVDDSFRVTHTDEFRGMRFVHLNKSVGLVFNIFGRRALEHLSQWHEDHGGVSTNTIDRYLSRAPDLSVVTCLPELVGHDSRLQSSIWSFRNARYDTLIHASQKRLISLAEKSKADHATLPTKALRD